MNYWVVHKEQVSLDLQIDEFKTKLEANKKQHYLRQQYHDAIVLDQNDINELYLQFRHSCTRTQQEFYKKNNK